MITQMMDQMVQNNPDMLRTMLEQQNPMLQQMFQNNPMAVAAESNVPLPTRPMFRCPLIVCLVIIE
jgi:hypothetical protein